MADTQTGCYALWDAVVESATPGFVEPEDTHGVFDDEFDVEFD